VRAAVERADERERKDVVPELDHRRRELEELALLALDHRLARLLVGLDGEQAQPVEEHGRRPEILGERLRIAREVRIDPLEHRLLEREHEHRGLDGRVALRRARRGELREDLAHRAPTPRLRARARRRPTASPVTAERNSFDTRRVSVSCTGSLRA
jgi:hypothetical protein